MCMCECVTCVQLVQEQEGPSDHHAGQGEEREVGASDAGRPAESRCPPAQGLAAVVPHTCTYTHSWRQLDDKADPQQGIMNMMKQMYDEGDDEMKVWGLCAGLSVCLR